MYVECVGYWMEIYLLELDFYKCWEMVEKWLAIISLAFLSHIFFFGNGNNNNRPAAVAISFISKKSIFSHHHGNYEMSLFQYPPHAHVMPSCLFSHFLLKERYFSYHNKSETEKDIQLRNETWNWDCNYVCWSIRRSIEMSITKILWVECPVLKSAQFS